MKKINLFIILYIFHINFIIYGAVIKESENTIQKEQDNTDEIVSFFNPLLNSAISQVSNQYPNLASLKDNRSEYSKTDDLVLNALSETLYNISTHVETIYNMEDTFTKKIVSKELASKIIDLIIQKLNIIFPSIIENKQDLLNNCISFSRRDYIQELPNKKCHIPLNRYYYIHYFIFKLMEKAELIKTNLEENQLLNTNIVYKLKNFPIKILDPKLFNDLDIECKSIDHINNDLVRDIPSNEKKQLLEMLDTIVRYTTISIDLRALSIKTIKPYFIKQSFLHNQLQSSILSDYLLYKYDIKSKKIILRDTDYFFNNSIHLELPNFYGVSTYVPYISSVNTASNLVFQKYYESGELERFILIVNKILSIYDYNKKLPISIRRDTETKYNVPDYLKNLKVINNENMKDIDNLQIQVIDGILKQNKKLLLNAISQGVDLNFKIVDIENIFDMKRHFQGYTPLLLAVLSTDSSIIQALLNYGARIDIHNNNDKSALEIALLRRPIVNLFSILLLAHYTNNTKDIKNAILTINSYLEELNEDMSNAKNNPNYKEEHNNHFYLKKLTSKSVWCFLSIIEKYLIEKLQLLTY